MIQFFLLQQFTFMLTNDVRNVHVFVFKQWEIKPIEQVWQEWSPVNSKDDDDDWDDNRVSGTFHWIWTGGSTGEWLWVWWTEGLWLAVWTEGPLIDWGRNLRTTASDCSHSDASYTGLFTFFWGESLSIDPSKLWAGILHDVGYQQCVQRWHIVKVKVQGGGDEVAFSWVGGWRICERSPLALTE